MAEPATNVAPSPLEQGLSAEFPASAGSSDDVLNIIPNVKNDEDFAKVKPGHKFRSPEGKILTRAYELSKDNPDMDFAALPEGAQYIGPDGKPYTKPTYSSIGFTAQMLHEMAPSDQAKEKALRIVYGNKVHRDLEGLYVQDEGGVIRRPGARDTPSYLATSAAEFGPSTGMGVGTYIGGGLGTLVEPGGGTALGAFGGMTLGAMAGRQFNNMILTLAGVHLSTEETISSMGWEGAGAAGGEVLGRGMASIPGVVQATKQAVGSGVRKVGGIRNNLADLLESVGVTPERARNVLGTTPESAAQASSITARGGKVPPSVLFTESPMLTKLEEFDAVFRSQNVFAEANRDFYEKEATRILESESIGVKPDTPLTAATKKVSSQDAGQLALDAAQRDARQADAVLENARRDFKAMVETRGQADVEAHRAALARLTEAQKQSAEAAETLVRAGGRSLRTDVDATLHLIGQNEDPSALARMTGAQYDAYNAATRLRARTMYNAAREASAAAAPPNVTSLADEAESFLRSMPESMRSRYPSEIADLMRLLDRENNIAGVRKAAGSDEKQEPITWSDLHHLRSWFRYGIDYNDMTPDMRTGALKLFENKINQILHDPNAPAEFKAATALLDQADEFYKRNIPFLNDEMVKATMKTLESGAGVNPNVIADQLFDPNRTSALLRARTILGENAWRGVEAAHVANILDHSKTLTPGQIDFPRFAKQVEEEVRTGLIDVAYSPAMASRMKQLATQMGQFEGSVPIRVDAGDTLSVIMRRGAAAKVEADALAKRDPLTALSKEMSRLDMEFNQAQRALQNQRRSDPLRHLYEPSMSDMAVKAADRILGSQDLIVAAAGKFGRDSKEFQALQKVYVHRFFQRPVGKVGGMRAELADEKKGMTEEVQALMFPGMTRGQMLQLVKDAEFLFGGRGTDFGGSMAAATRVLNPQSHMPIPIPKGVGSTIGLLPGIGFVHRLVLGKFYKMAMDAVSHPNFINWLAGKLQGSAEDRAIARSVVQQRLRLGGLMGAGTGQVLMQGGRNQPQAVNE